MDLFKYQDLKYKEFNDRIINTIYPTIGIRIPILRDLAKKMAKEDYLSYINDNHTYMEEYMIMGLIIGYIDVDFDERLKLLDKYVPFIKDWSMTDIPASNLKCFKKNLDKGYTYIKKLLKQDGFIRRFGVILLLDYYIDDKYIDDIIKLSLEDDKDYYIVMAKAWLLSVVYLKYPNEVIKLLKDNSLDKKLNNLTISKICDSRRVSIEDKTKLKEYRR